MDYKDYLKKARDNFDGKCVACNICNGVACSNKIPGPGAKGSGTVAIANYNAWQEYHVVMDTINDVKSANINFNLFGLELSAPIIAGPVGAVQAHYGELFDDITYNEKLINECSNEGVIAMSGDGVNDEIMIGASKVISANNGIGIPTIKPWNKDKVFEKIDIVKKANPIALAMDVDAAGLPFLKNMTPPAGSKTVDELKEIIDYADKPFIVKGIMSVKGALKAKEAGASAIIVSNHGGRVLDSTPSTASVLKEIADVIKDDMTILVDGGIRSGIDIFKAIALGADGVVIARPFVVSTYGDFNSTYINKLKEELKDTMLMCGAKTLADINYDMIKK